MDHACIYLVEDDPMIVQLLSKHLAKTYEVKTVENFRKVSQEVQHIQPDLILMDITLPYYNGFYWTTEIRKEATMPIIFISSSEDEMDAVMAMNMGGDDFISKPFSLTVLDAKIAAFLRRIQQFNQGSDLSLDRFKLEGDGRFSNGKDKIQLTPTEARLLRILIQSRGQVVSKDYILNKLWENEDFIDPNTLSVNMTRLRKKVSDIGFDRIHTVRGVGYVVQ